MNKHFFLVISGPTGVGKTDFVHELAGSLAGRGEVINADMGQLYSSLSIGTAKPTAAERGNIPHHLFDIVDQPINYSVIEYRRQVLACMQQIWQRNGIPILVGGSGFYIKSLFFPPVTNSQDHHTGIKQVAQEQLRTKFAQMSRESLWRRLYELDPARAAHIHPNDRYRLERALILQAIGRQASAQKPIFSCPAFCGIIYLTRTRRALYDRINRRVSSMFAAGWVDEVYNLMQTSEHQKGFDWFTFLREKKIIGYPEIIDFISCHSKLAECGITLEELQDRIRQKTRAYAKRQLTFWRSFQEQLKAHDYQQSCVKFMYEFNLTFLTVDVYIRMLIERLT